MDDQQALACCVGTPALTTRDVPGIADDQLKVVIIINASAHRLVVLAELVLPGHRQRGVVLNTVRQNSMMEASIWALQNCTTSYHVATMQMC